MTVRKTGCLSETSESTKRVNKKESVSYYTQRKEGRHLSVSYALCLASSICLGSTCIPICYVVKDTLQEGLSSWEMSVLVLLAIMKSPPVIPSADAVIGGLFVW